MVALQALDPTPIAPELMYPVPLAREPLPLQPLASEPTPPPLNAPAADRTQGLRRRLAAGLLLLALALALLLWSPPAWGADDAVVLQRGARLFANHCAGCHVNGGNVIRRNKTLRRQDLLREGIKGPLDVARIAAQGKGQMSGYQKVLGDGGADAVGAWVWRQAELGWPRR